MPTLIESTDAPGSASTAYALSIGETAHGSISGSGDHDWYRVELTAGQTYTFAMVGIAADNLRNSFLNLYAPDGTTVVAGNDNSAPNQNAWFTYTATTSGTFFLDAAGVSTSTGRYGVSATLGTQAAFDDQMGAGIIDSGYHWPGTRGTAAVVTFGFQVTDPGERANFAVFNDVMQSATREILQLYADVAGLTFVDRGVTDAADMRFSVYDQSDSSGGHAHYPSSTNNSGSSGDVHLNYGNRTSIDLGNYTWMTMLHEVGHALGLSHPGDYGDGGLGNLFVNDSIQYTNLSYAGPSRTGGDFGSVGSDADTPMLYDIMALQLMYGANMSTRTGDTVYGFNSNAGSRIYDFSLNAEPGLCIWDAGGSDTLDCSGFGANQFIDLRAGSFSDVGGLAHNISIAYGAAIENAIGGRGNDTITAGTSPATISGGAGNDRLVGGAGNDLLIGRGAGVADSPFTPIHGIELNNGSTSTQYAAVTNYNGIRGSNSSSVPSDPVRFTIEMLVKVSRLPSDEVVFFSYANDQTSNAILLSANTGGTIEVTYRGTTQDTGIAASLLTGGEHRLSLSWDGSVGGQYVIYIDGVSVYTGSHPNQHWQMNGGGTLIFGQEQDNFTPGAVNATGFNGAQIFPGTLADIRVFNTVRSAADIAANAFAPIANAASTGGLVNNWQMTASPSSVVPDARGGAELVLVGSPAVATFGNWDNDTLLGGSGDDTLQGGLGNDSLDGGTNGAQGDTVDYSAVTSNVTIWLDAAYHLAVGGAEDGVDTIYNIENAVTGSGNDLIFADPNANSLVLGSGNDVVVDQGGNDTIDAGSGRDTVFGGGGNDSIIAAIGDDVVAGGLGDDAISAGAGVDFVLAEEGNDSVSGGDDRDLIFGQAGNDNLTGDGGDDYLSGGDQDDQLHGGAGLDVLLGDAGNDTAFGDDDRDWVYGFAGNDTLNGGAGDDIMGGASGLDVLNGGDGADALFGEADADTIAGGSGNDYVVGGSGINTISLGTGLDIIQSTRGEGGTQIVSDFGIADFDQIWLLNWGFANAAEALAACQQVGANVVLHRDADDVVLENITIAQLNAFNFVLF